MLNRKKIIVGLVGESGSGKDTVAEYLQEKHKAILMRFADKTDSVAATAVLEKGGDEEEEEPKS